MKKYNVTKLLKDYILFMKMCFSPPQNIPEKMCFVNLLSQFHEEILLSWF